MVVPMRFLRDRCCGRFGQHLRFASTLLPYQLPLHSKTMCVLQFDQLALFPGKT